MPAHIVHAIAWNDHRDRSLVPWLLLVPLTGALLAAEAVDALAYDRHPIPLVLASGVPVVVAIMLVMVSRRLVGGRRRVDYVALPTGGLGSRHNRMWAALAGCWGCDGNGPRPTRRYQRPTAPLDDRPLARSERE